MNNEIPANVPHDLIYKDYCVLYDQLRMRMDYEGNILKNILAIADVENKAIVEMAAGTGKLTALFAPLADRVNAFDISQDMVDFARKKLSNYTNASIAVADNYQIPLPDQSADLVIEGWSLGYMAFAAGDDWTNAIDLVIAEMERLLKPSGSIILLGTLGTGVHRPAAPNTVLAKLYEYLVNEKGFKQSDWFKTDYRFHDLDEAVALTSFFWSSKFGAYVQENQLTTLPECSAIWHKSK